MFEEQILNTELDKCHQHGIVHLFKKSFTNGSVDKALNCHYHQSTIGATTNKGAFTLYSIEMGIVSSKSRYKILIFCYIFVACTAEGSKKCFSIYSK